MKKLSHGHVIGIPVSSKAYAIEHLPGEAAGSDGDQLAISLQHPNSRGSFNSRQSSKGQVTYWISKLSRRADSFAHGIREHVTLGPKFSETVKGKLSLGARILQAGGIERVFRQAFSVDKGERLLKASQCHLSTTAGPIAGMLFISTRKISFRSDRSLTLTSPKGDVARVPYKVLIPLRRVKKVKPTENVDKPEQKYIHIVTVDGFEFWFMGFVSYQRSYKYMKQAILEVQ